MALNGHRQPFPDRAAGEEGVSVPGMEVHQRFSKCALGTPEDPKILLRGLQGNNSFN